MELDYSVKLSIPDDVAWMFSSTDENYTGDLMREAILDKIKENLSSSDFLKVAVEVSRVLTPKEFAEKKLFDQCKKDLNLK